jgi:hypothetical protein
MLFAFAAPHSCANEVTEMGKDLPIKDKKIPICPKKALETLQYLALGQSSVLAP